ncbi:MAG: UDP-glucose 4-epimerase GalE [Planctomycetota bacterium]
MKVLVVGGAGYVGSHAVRECVRRGVEVVVFDNYTTGNPQSVHGVERVSGDLMDPRSIRSVFENFRFDAVFHFASLSSAVESVREPALYYRNNVGGTLNLLHTMLDCRVQRLIYSSTAAVYGLPHQIPIHEDHPTEPTHPYGRSKALVESMLREVAATTNLRFASLRYFNAAGADPTGEIGEDHPRESHLIPSIFRAALTEGARVQIFGTDYDTPDGTCIRDFVHVSDIADAHLLALEHLDTHPNQVYNLGSAEGYSVREVIDEAQSLLDRPLRIVEAERRTGDPPVLVATNDKASRILRWQPRRSDLRTILETAWNWHRRHPRGYGAAAPQSEAGRNAELFGDLAVRLEFVSEEDVQRALARQLAERDVGNQHKLIGMHMLEMGLLSTSQLIELLKYYEER